jgi:hypothetical protein
MKLISDHLPEWLLVSPRFKELENDETGDLVTCSSINTTKNKDPFLNLAFGSVKPVEKGDHILCLLAIDPIFLLMIRLYKVNANFIVIREIEHTKQYPRSPYFSCNVILKAACVK